MNLTGWADGAWADGSWVPESWGVVVAPPPGLVEPQRRSSSPRRRYRIIEDPDKLIEELKQEEKVVAKEKKQLKILIKKSSLPSVEGVLYQQIHQKIEVLEAKIDDRMEKIANLMIAIQTALDEQAEDDEEVLLIS